MSKRGAWWFVWEDKERRERERGLQMAALVAYCRQVQEGSIMAQILTGQQHRPNTNPQMYAWPISDIIDILFGFHP